MEGTSMGMSDTKHKVFISFYHEDDEKYRKKFEKLFGDLFIIGEFDLGKNRQRRFVFNTQVMCCLLWIT